MQNPCAVLYCHLWPALLYNIFPHYLINGTIFEKKKLKTKCVLIFSTAFVWHISHSKKKWARYDQNFLLTFTQSTRYSYSILMKLEFSGFHISFQSNTVFTEISWKSVVAAELFRTEWQTNITKLTVVFAILRSRLTMFALYLCFHIAYWASTYGLAQACQIRDLLWGPNVQFRCWCRGGVISREFTHLDFGNI